MSDSAARRRGGGGYSAMVRFMRIGLPVTALGLILALFLVYRPPSTGHDLTFVEFGSLASGLELKNFRFTGATSAGEPFLVRADRAIPDGPDPNEVELETVSGQITRAGGDKTTLEANSGVVTLKDETIVLTGDVVIRTDGGYEMRTDVLRGDTKTRNFVTDGEVRGQGPAGEIIAGRMRATDADGGVAVFEDGVIVTIRRLVDSRAAGE